MPKLKVITVFGTRPEAIKMAPIVQRLKQCHDQFNEVTVVTGQHREMLDQVLTTFHIKPDYDLNIMKARQTLPDSPYPEEMNRQLTDVLSDLYFAPTEQSQANLLAEHHPEEQIFVTGNTAIDALDQTVQTDYHHQVLDLIDPNKK